MVATPSVFVMCLDSNYLSLQRLRRSIIRAEPADYRIIQSRREVDRDGHDFMRFPEHGSQRECGLADRATNNGLETHKIMTVPVLPAHRRRLPCCEVI
jgi:hypothetical protein